MRNQYRQLKEQIQERFNSFPMRFAFNEEQFTKAMEWLGLEPTDTDKIVSIAGGGFIRKTDAAAYRKLCDTAAADLEAAFVADPDGSGFIRDAFSYELGNHEYIITGNLRDTLNALGLTAERVNADPRMKAGLKLALAQYAESIRLA